MSGGPRRRRENVPGGRKRLVRVYVSEEELARLGELARAAGGITLARVLAEKALSSDGETAAERRVAVVELFAIHRELSVLAGRDGVVREELRPLAVRVVAAIDALAAAGIGG